MMKVYYAHSVGIYNSKQEERDIRTLTDLGFEVVSLNTKEISEGVAAYKVTHGQDAVMEYFKDIMDECGIIAFRSHPDGKIGSGVWFEIDYMQNQGKPVIELPALISTRALSVADTKEYLRLTGNR